MPGPDVLVPGAPAWVDLSTTDVDAASAFYEELFGWEADDVVDPRFGGYRVFRLDGRRVGGIGMNTVEDPGPPHWGVFLLTFNAATTSELIGEAGGTVLFEPMVVPTRGVIGMAVDATGAVVGYWQPGVVEGFDVFGEIGSASWFELNASDFDAAERFYAHAFDWSVVRGDPAARPAAAARVSLRRRPRDPRPLRRRRPRMPRSTRGPRRPAASDSRRRCPRGCARPARTRRGAAPRRCE